MLTNNELHQVIYHLQGVMDLLKSHLNPAPPEPVPFNPPYVPVSPSGFQIPTGTYRGRRLNELDNDTLRNLYNGFKGCGKLDIADTILAEIHLRQGNL